MPHTRLQIQSNNTQIVHSKFVVDTYSCNRYKMRCEYIDWITYRHQNDDEICTMCMHTAGNAIATNLCYCCCSFFACYNLSVRLVELFHIVVDSVKYEWKANKVASFQIFNKNLAKLVGNWLNFILFKSYWRTQLTLGRFVYKQHFQFWIVIIIYCHCLMADCLQIAITKPNYICQYNARLNSIYYTPNNKSNHTKRAIIWKKNKTKHTLHNSVLKINGTLYVVQLTTSGHLEFFLRLQGSLEDEPSSRNRVPHDNTAPTQLFVFIWSFVSTPYAKNSPYYYSFEAF